MAGFLLGAGITFQLTDNEEVVNLAGLGTMGGALVATIALREWWNSVPPEEAETRTRVREAEHDLEEALRNRPQPAATTEEPPPPDDTGIAHPQPLNPSAPSPAQMALPELWALTHKRLDHYHQTALGQARRSFRNAQVAMISGFLLLVVFVIVAINASTTTGAVVAGGLGAVAAALAGYISRTFIRSQETSASHLRAYFDQPLEFARYLAAERVAMQGDLSSEQRAEVLTAMVQAMVTGPPPASPPESTAGASL